MDEHAPAALGLNEGRYQATVKSAGGCPSLHSGNTLHGRLSPATLAGLFRAGVPPRGAQPMMRLPR